MKKILRKIYRRLVPRKATNPNPYNHALTPYYCGRGMEKSLNYLVLSGLKVDYVYDVGAAVGTPWLYEAFPNSQHLLFEPLPSHVAELKKNYSQLSNFKIYETALGGSNGEIEMRVYEKSTGSGFFEVNDDFRRFKDIRGSDLKSTIQKVAINKLDDFDRDGSVALKLDVEGYEMNVLKSGLNILKKTKIIVIEMAILKRFEQEASFAEMIMFLDAQGFELVDIPTLSYPLRDFELFLIDAVFIRMDEKIQTRWIDSYEKKDNTYNR